MPTANRKATKFSLDGTRFVEETANEVFFNFDLRDGKALISATTANVTMTEVQQLCGVWEVSGLTAARQLIIDAALGSTHTPVVYNNSSYDLTVKTNAAGSNRSVVVAAGKARFLRHDNVHVDDAITETGATPIVNAARVYNAGSIAVATATLQYMTFDSEVRDDGGLHSTSSNTDRLTALVSGWYYAWGCLAFEANAAGYRVTTIRLNAGATSLSSHVFPAASGNATVAPVGTLCYLAAGDYIRLGAYHTAGVTLNIEASPEPSPIFGMILLARA